MQLIIFGLPFHLTRFFYIFVLGENDVIKLNKISHFASGIF